MPFAVGAGRSATYAGAAAFTACTDAAGLTGKQRLMLLVVQVMQLSCETG
jgi:hypothetical protein